VVKKKTDVGAMLMPIDFSSSENNVCDLFLDENHVPAAPPCGPYKDRREGQRVKHIDVIHHFARDHVASGELSFVHCKSEENVSDCLTEALSRPLFEKGLEGLGMVST
jgi:hypothetical protein